MLDQLLKAFLLTLFLSIVLNIVLKRFEIPTIIGYIITGTIISEFFNLKSNEYLAYVAEFGIVFLMFTIGLEFSFKHLMGMKRDVFVNGNLQVFISGLILAFFISFLFHLNQNNSIIIGLALSLSSTAIVLKILNDNGDIKRIYGRKALGILIFQDIAVIPILIMVDMFSSTQTSLNELLTKTFVGAIVLIAVLYIVARYLINWIFRRVLQTKSQEIFITTVIFIVIGSSALAHLFGFSFSLGAFLAGMMISETEYKHKVEADFIPFRDILLGIFFISIGMQISIPIIAQNIFLVLDVAIGAMVVKAFVVFTILRVNQTTRVAFKTAATISQVGEFGLAVFGLMATRSLIDSNTSQILIAASIMSMFLTPFIIKKLEFLTEKAEQEITPESIIVEDMPEMKNHVVVFGYGNLGQEVVLELIDKKLPYLAIESDPTLVELGKSRDENVYLGSAFRDQTFINAHVEEAASVIVAISNEQKLELITKTISSYTEKIQTIIIISEMERKEKLFEDLGPNFCFVKQEKALSELMVQKVMENKYFKLPSC